MRLREQMYQLVESYQQSGKSQQEFCRQAGIGLAKLNYWIRKHRQQGSPTGFLQVDTAPAAGRQDLDILYPNGVRLRATGADLSLLSQLIRLY